MMNQNPIILQNLFDKEIRLDKFLANELEGHSRSYIQKIITAGGVSIDGVPVYKKAERVSPGMEIEVVIPEAEDTTLQGEDIPLDIIFENDDLIAVNKPAGLVHRLDQDTSGVILLAKNDRTHQFLQDQFRDRQVDKEYLALVDGRPPTPNGRVEVAIGRDPKYRQRMAPVLERDGKEAISEYFTLGEFPKHTYLRVKIMTGRTHQIRVHLNYLGCPVVGDTVYGRKNPSIPVERQFLHAFRLSIVIPGEEDKHCFEAPLALDLEGILNQLREKLPGA